MDSLHELANLMWLAIKQIFSGDLSAIEVVGMILVVVGIAAFLGFFLKVIRMDFNTKVSLSGLVSKLRRGHSEVRSDLGTVDGDAPGPVTKPQIGNDNKALFRVLLNEKTILVVGALIIALMLLFPPYYAEFSGKTLNYGYSFVLSPPVRIAKIDGATLMAQCVGVGLITILAWLACRKK